MFWTGLFVGAAGMYGLLAVLAWAVRTYDAKHFAPSELNEAAREYMAKVRGEVSK